MKEPTIIVQHQQQPTSHHVGVVRKSSPDLNNNGSLNNHAFHAYNYVQAQQLAENDYNTDGTSTMRYLMFPSAVAVAASTSGNSSQVNTVNTINTTTATTINDMIADTLKDEHNPSGTVSNSNDEDTTAQYLSLTTANEMQER